ncbi:MAG: hypothetical protein ACJAU2_001175 [Maribacter sp.]|jgi:hypothetical protein
MKYIGFIFLILVLASCGGTRVYYDYDETVDFSAYSTYGYYSDMDTGLGQLDEKRLMNAMGASLQSKGLLFSEEPDMLVNVQSAILRGQPGNSVGVGLGGGTIGGGIAVGLPVGGPKLLRELTIDFVDVKRNVLLWQALSESPFKEGDTPTAKQQKIKELIKKIFEKYPPKQRR